MYLNDYTPATKGRSVSELCDYKEGEWAVSAALCLCPRGEFTTVSV